VAGWQAADNAPIGALNRQFGEDPTVVGAQAAAFIEGMKSVGVATAVKHFPGLGRVTGNTDFTAVGVVDTTTDFDDPVVAAFATAMAAEPGLVMVSLATYAQVDPHNPAAFSPIIVTDWLRGRLGWQGVVISDSLTASAVAHVPVSERAVRFIDAGGDIAIFATAAEAAAALDGIIAQMAVSPEFAVKANAAAWRVLVAKSALGLVPLS
jgi:beta-N-acetylhexosaminidase